MAAPKGNQAWLLRLKHGRTGTFSHPDEIWENFLEYAQWARETPLLEIDFRGKDATQVAIPKLRVLTKDGFALACGLSCWAKISKYRDKSEEFSQVITRVEQSITQQKFEGAAAGLFNHNIIARDLGLMNQEQVNMNVSEVILPPSPNEK